MQQQMQQEAAAAQAEADACRQGTAFNALSMLSSCNQTSLRSHPSAQLPLQTRVLGQPYSARVQVGAANAIWLHCFLQRASVTVLASSRTTTSNPTHAVGAAWLQPKHCGAALPALQQQQAACSSLRKTSASVSRWQICPSGNVTSNNSAVCSASPS